MADLVLMKVAVAFGKWFPGMIAGFTAEQAAIICSRGLATYVEEPSQQEAAAETDDGDLVDIPEGWDARHHLYIMALAKRIAGEDTPAGLTLEAAKAIITDELALRAQKGA